MNWLELFIDKKIISTCCISIILCIVSVFLVAAEFQEESTSAGEKGGITNVTDPDQSEVKGTNTDTGITSWFGVIEQARVSKALKLAITEEEEARLAGQLDELEFQIDERLFDYYLREAIGERFHLDPGNPELGFDEELLAILSDQARSWLLAEGADMADRLREMMREMANEFRTSMERERPVLTFYGNYHVMTERENSLKGGLPVDKPEWDLDRGIISNWKPVHVVRNIRKAQSTELTTLYKGEPATVTYSIDWDINLEILANIISEPVSLATTPDHAHPEAVIVSTSPDYYWKFRTKIRGKGLQTRTPVEISLEPDSLRYYAYLDTQPKKGNWKRDIENNNITIYPKNDLVDLTLDLQKGEYIFIGNDEKKEGALGMSKGISPLFRVAWLKESEARGPITVSIQLSEHLLDDGKIRLFDFSGNSVNHESSDGGRMSSSKFGIAEYLNHEETSRAESVKSPIITKYTNPEGVQFTEIPYVKLDGETHKLIIARSKDKQALIDSIQIPKAYILYKWRFSEF